MMPGIPARAKVSYRHPLEEGVGPMRTFHPMVASSVSYRHPLEEGLGRNPGKTVRQLCRLSVTVIH